MAYGWCFPPFGMFVVVVAEYLVWVFGLCLLLGLIPLLGPIDFSTR